MRITTRMMNLMRRRSGVQKRGNSLANYVGKKGAAGARLSAMNATNVRAARVEQNSYDRLKKSADGLESALSSMTSKVDSGSTDLSASVASMVEKYNDTLTNLKNASGVLNQFYLQSMRELAGTSRKELAEIGISVTSGGSLSLNKEKLAAADAEKVKKLMGSTGEFAQRAGYLASRVADNAEVNAASLSGRYTSKGSIAESYLNRYNFWG